MKRMLTLLLSCLLLTACYSANPPPSTPTEPTNTTTTAVPTSITTTKPLSVWEATLQELHWNEIEAFSSDYVDWQFEWSAERKVPFDSPTLIHTKEEALALGKRYFEETLAGLDDDYLHGINHYLKENYWQFSFDPNYPGTYDWVGGTLDIVVDGNTGKALYIWPGE